MRSSAGNQDCRARSCLYLVITYAHAQRSFQNVPGFVVLKMAMKWRDESRWSDWRTRIAPFCDHKIVLRGTKYIAGK